MSLSSFWRSSLQEPLPPGGISSVSGQREVSCPCCFILVRTWGRGGGGGRGMLVSTIVLTTAMVNNAHCVLHVRPPSKCLTFGSCSHSFR